MAIYRRIKFANVNMVAWKQEAHFRKSAESSVCARFKITRLKATYIFTWLYCWYGFMMSICTRSAMQLTNKLRKWTEMYGLKICLRNVRHPSRTRRFCFVHTCSPGMQIYCYGPTYENPSWRPRPEIAKPFVRNNIFAKFQRIPTFSE